MVDFRGQISAECDRQASALIDHHGFRKRSELIEFLIRLEYRRVAELRNSEGIYHRTADVLSRELKLTRPIAPNEIERVVFQRGKPIAANTGFSGEPYLIREKEWYIP